MHHIAYSRAIFDVVWPQPDPNPNDDPLDIPQPDPNDDPLGYPPTWP